MNWKPINEIAVEPGRPYVLHDSDGCYVIAYWRTLSVRKKETMGFGVSGWPDSQSVHYMDEWTHIMVIEAP